MLEKLILNTLSRALDVPVFMEVPECPPARFAVLQRTGGGRRGPLYTATVAVQSYAPTLLLAAEQNEAVKQAMGAVGALPEICRVEPNSDYNFTDTATKRYRYQAVFDVTYY